MNQMPNRIG